MMLATSKAPFEQLGLGDALQRWLRPAVGFDHPTDVLKDPMLTLHDKRAVLSSWASDASAVQDEPTMRWLLGTPAPVPLADIQAAMARLDRWDAWGLSAERSADQDRSINAC
ncbi:MAG TPA: hypothetical protein VKU90_11605 [Caulobacteraceae bacterium]|jgi:hypothetical protein|nr:hypothetical protein [Caulobacteraceae bacterium]